MENKQKTDRSPMQGANARRLLNAIQTAGEMSRAQAAEATGINIMTVGRIAERMIACGLLREREKEGGSHVGRPPRLLSLEGKNLLCASMFLERKTLHIGLVDPRGDVHSYTGIPIPEELRPSERLTLWMTGCLDRFLKEHKALHPCPVVGVVVPGILDIARGEIVFSANFQWQNVPLCTQLREYLPKYDFVLENDVKAAALAEYQFGNLDGCRSMVALNIGDGIGAAVIIDGEVYRGKNSMAGEIGHIIINPAGKVCECGKMGCLQTYLTPRALLAEARTVYPDTTLPGLFTLLREGSPFAAALINQVVEYISVAINLLVNAYAPEAVLLCGRMIREGPDLKELVADGYRKKLNPYMMDAFQLKFERLGTSAHLIGGGAQALRRTLDRLCGIG